MSAQSLDKPRGGAVEHGTAGLAVRVSGLDKKYETSGGLVHALDDVALDVAAGSFVSVLGPSGCGKSTLLRIVAGLEPYADGSVEVAGDPVTGPRRDVGMVFQQSVLLPWRTVLGNVLLPVDVRRSRSADATRRANDLLDLVGLSGFADRYPRELSGGMQQRAALVRALITEPRYLLMDEPFGALDAMTRETMNAELLRVWEQYEATVLFVTHSISEAVFLSDTVVVMSSRPGRVVARIDVDLPRPRTFDVMGTPEFGRLTQQIRALLDAKGTLE